MSATSIRHTSVIVKRARELREVGWTYRQIQQVLQREHGVCPSRDSILRWTSPAYAEKSRGQIARRNLRKREEEWTFQRSSQTTPEYRAGLARALHAEGVLIPSIARVFRVLFPDQPWSRERVETLLNRERVAA